MPARMPTTVASETSVNRPFQSQNSVEMPKAAARSASTRLVKGMSATLLQVADSREKNVRAWVTRTG